LKPCRNRNRVVKALPPVVAKGTAVAGEAAVITMAATISVAGADVVDVDADPTARKAAETISRDRTAHSAAAAAATDRWIDVVVGVDLIGDRMDHADRDLNRMNRAGRKF
jgi:hypothetical protein